jgi:hypothetical protein
MKKFSELGIKTQTSHFVGDKTKVTDILNMDVIFHDYKIQKSKFEHLSSGDCLWAQIEIEGKKHVLFTGSTVLMNTIKQVPKDAFPFSTKITRNGKAYQFN